MSHGGEDAAPDEATRRILQALEQSLGITRALWELLAPGVAGPDTTTHASALETAFARLQEAGTAFDWPALGLTRERQEAAQRLAGRAHDFSQAQLRLALVWGQIVREALQALAEKIAAELAQGRDIAGPRALYDLWIDCGEAAFVRHAHGGEFARAQGALADATSTLRIEQRRAVESWARELDLPTRDELNTVHRRLKALREEVRALRRELAESRAAHAAPRRATRAKSPRRRS